MYRCLFSTHLIWHWSSSIRDRSLRPGLPPTLVNTSHRFLSCTRPVHNIHPLDNTVGIHCRANLFMWHRLALNTWPMALQSWVLPLNHHISINICIILEAYMFSSCLSICLSVRMWVCFPPWLLKNPWVD